MSARPTPWPWYFAVSPPQVSDKLFWFDEMGARHGETPNMLVHFDSPEDAKLFFEAGTIYHETGLTPRQLADHRAELLDLAIQYRDDLRYPPSEDSRERRLERILAAIAKATGAA